MSLLVLKETELKFWNAIIPGFHISNRNRKLLLSLTSGTSNSRHLFLASPPKADQGWGIRGAFPWQEGPPFDDFEHLVRLGKYEIREQVESALTTKF